MQTKQDNDQNHGPTEEVARFQRSPLGIANQ